MVTLLLPQTKTTMGKSNHFCGQCGFHTDFTNYIYGGVVKRVIVSISEADMWVGRGYTTPVATLSLCGADYKSVSPRMCSSRRD